jgi:outer membrane protein OmpA-like peptidoglycan-associated protein
MMRKFLFISLLLAVSACAYLPPELGGPQVATSPNTPVFFQPFSTALDGAALTSIAAAAAAAQQRPSADVSVIGAADSFGTTQTNVALSKARAEAVAGQLAADGVAPSRIHAYGIGETGRPDNTAQANRRVLISIGA